jgi:hypothetical protein
MPTCRRNVRKPVIRSFGTLTALASLILLPPVAEAQNAARPDKWTIELYGGGSVASGSTSGTPIASFPAGTPFTLQSGAPSRAVSSWFFGDGALLLNQVLARFATNAATTFPRIAALDDALRSGGGKQGSGALFGLRVGRAVTEKISLEFGIERGLAKMELSDELAGALQEASDSFVESFQALLATAPVTNLSVTSAVTTRDSSSAQTRFSAALKWTVYSGGRLQAYLAGGGGVIINSGEAPQSVLNGRYTFRLFGAFPMDESDRVVVTLSQKKTNPMGLLGAGFTFDLSSTSGLRADVRLLLSSTKDRVTMTAAPGVVVGNPPNTLSTDTAISPGIQFTTQSGMRSTLSGPNENLTIFTGSGLGKQIAFSLGIFKRF